MRLSQTLLVKSFCFRGYRRTTKASPPNACNGKEISGFRISVQIKKMRLKKWTILPKKLLTVTFSILYDQTLCVVKNFMSLVVAFPILETFVESWGVLGNGTLWDTSHWSKQYQLKSHVIFACKDNLSDPRNKLPWSSIICP